MAAYSTAFTWKALTEIIELNPEKLIEVISDDSGDTFKFYLRQALELSEQELDFNIEVLERIAYEVTQVVDDDFNRLLVTVKSSTAIIREIFTPNDARVLIEAFEQKKTPELSVPEILIGIYLVIKGGERDIASFELVEALVELETP